MASQPRPFSKSKSPLAWEQAWQRFLDIRYVHTNITMLEAAGKATKRITPASSRTANEPSVIINRQALCKLQRDLLRLATQKCAVYDKFEDKWRAAGSEVREKHYFEAMKRVCGFPDMEDQRMYAPEISLRKFQANNGQGYLDLLRLLLPDQVPPNQYVRIENPAFEALVGIQTPLDTTDALIDPRVTPQQMIDVHRHIFISLMVWHTLLSFYDMSEQTDFMRTERKSIHPRKLAEMESTSGRNEEQMHTIAKEHKQAYKKSVWACMHCREPEYKFPEGTLKSCSKCKAIERMVMYCSRDCQVEDWKHGNPPHKTICAPNYRRSIALVHQISLLEKDPSIDYFLIPPAPEPDIGVTMRGEKSKLFKWLRDRAFETGDPEAVGFMYKLLSGVNGFGDDELERQLGAEYEMDVKELREQVRLAGDDLRTLASRKSLSQCRS